MPRISEVYGGNYLKAEDIKGRGDTVVTIESISVEEVDGKKRAVVHFKGKDKTLLLNVTNANMIEELLGTDEMDNWEGSRVCLYVTKVDFQGKRVDAIRVKAAPQRPQTVAPQPPPPPATTELMDDDIPF